MLRMEGSKSYSTMIYSMAQRLISNLPSQIASHVQKQNYSSYHMNSFRLSNPSLENLHIWICHGQTTMSLSKSLSFELFV